MFKWYAHVACVLLGIGCGGVDGDAGNAADTAGILQVLQHAQPLTAEAWSFIAVPGMTCANGSATGIGINLAIQSNSRLLIYLEGGGGCWDATTCQDSFYVQNSNLNGFGATDFEQVMVTGSSKYVPAIAPGYGATGIWDRTSTANPYKDYNYVYIPYCTADFHEGNLPHSPVDGLSHVGYINMTRALAYLSRIFTPSSTTDVVLSGSSAGGFGALWNFPQTQTAFGNIPVTLISESGPPLPAPYLAPSLEEAWRVAWGLDGTKGAAAPSTHLFPYLQWMAQTYPDRKFGFIDMTGDVTIAWFLGLSLFGPNSLGNGLFSLRLRLQQSSPNVSFYFVPSLVHGHIHQDPAIWPNPTPPFGNSKLSLSNWIRLEVL